MPKSFITRDNHYLLLVPFLYAFFSRMRGARGFGFNAATLWIPGLILTAGNDSMGWNEVVWRYFAGYAAFISVYEIGYIINDTWGLRHDSTPRRRIEIDYQKPFYFLFALIRLLAVVGIAICLDSLVTPGYWGILGLLAAAILVHNALSREEFKMTSFFQLSVMRFAVPILLAGTSQSEPTVLAVGALLFSFPRLLTYQDGKGRLFIPERKRPSFMLGNYVVVTPAVALIFILSNELPVLATWGYYVCLGSVILWARRRSPV